MLKLLISSLQIIRDSNFGLSLINEEESTVPSALGILFCGYVTQYFLTV